MHHSVLPTSHNYAPKNWICLLFILKLHILVVWCLNFVIIPVLKFRQTLFQAILIFLLAVPPRHAIKKCHWYGP